ncbi:hypothetical protein CIB84_014574, partial [Bambusicola thoracicus]
VSLVVNVASECGFTDSHYKALQQLQKDLGPYHFNVLAFPCNQFGQQEPDTNKEIESFARKTYGASFPMFSKVANSSDTGYHLIKKSAYDCALRTIAQNSQEKSKVIESILLHKAELPSVPLHQLDCVSIIFQVTNV